MILALPTFEAHQLDGSYQMLSELNDPIDQYERFAEQQRELDPGLDDAKLNP